MAGDRFILRSTTTSPFGRKVRMAIEVLNLSDRIERQDADTLDENDTLRQQNPLGKMPCLILPNGQVLFDSRVIVEFLQELSGSNRLVPHEGVSRYVALTRAVLADGISDAALLMVYEGRFRPDETKHSERWLSHQRDKVLRGLTAFESDLPDFATTDIVSIALSCALGYLDWRRPVEWRNSFPRTAEWLRNFAAHEPAFDRTAG
jgi:glutathione S-transferase